MVQEFKLPDLGEGIHEGEILEVQVSPDDEIKEGTVIFVVETDKAAVEIPSPFTGKVKEVRIKPNDMVHVGEVMMVFEVAGIGEKPQEAAATAPEKPTAKAAVEGIAMPEKRKGPVPASPATRRIARELDVDLSKVSGTGPAGLVTAEDVRMYAQEPKAIGETVAEAPPAEEIFAPQPMSLEAPKLPDFSQWGAVERTPLRSVRRAVAKKMALSWAQIPHVSHEEQADITELESMRRKNKKEVEEHGGKLTITIFTLKAVVAALEAFPRFNASLDLTHEEIVLKKYYDLGIATDTERGLMVPVVRNVNRKTMLELSIELPQLTEKARAGKLSLDEIKGGTFTITNIGGIGGTSFQPIINFPEVAILGLGKAQWQPIVRKDSKGDLEIVPRLILPMVLSFDHRVLDGAEAARFMNDIKETLENPARILFFEL